jgi:hypothetical protein
MLRPPSGPFAFAPGIAWGARRAYAPELELAHIDVRSGAGGCLQRRADHLERRVRVTLHGPPWSRTTR